MVTHLFISRQAGALKYILDKIGAANIRASWFDPRTGKSELIDTFPGKGTRKFTPPSNGRGKDWILVLDDVSKNFKAPGV